jgi:hypothetical protein
MNQNPDTQPIRYYAILSQLEELQKDLSHEELKGATKVLGLLAQELEHMHFDKKLEMNQQTLVKTITEAYENVLEDSLYKHQNSPSK